MLAHMLEEGFVRVLLIALLGALLFSAANFVLLARAVLRAELAPRNKKERLHDHNCRLCLCGNNTKLKIW